MYINSWDARNYKQMGGSLLVTLIHSVLVCASCLDMENGGEGYWVG